MNEPLNEVEQRFVALAIAGLAMRQGPQSSQIAIDSCSKIGTGDLLEQCLRDWVNFAGGVSPQGPVVETANMITGLIAVINEQNETFEKLLQRSIAELPVHPQILAEILGDKAKTHEKLLSLIQVVRPNAPKN